MTEDSLIRMEQGIEDVNIFSIRSHDLIIDPAVQLKCQNCGMYGRTLKCPPHVPKYHKAMKRLSRYNHFRLLISSVDEAPWFKRQKEKFKVSDWVAHYKAGNTTFQIAKKMLNHAVYEYSDFLKAHGIKHLAFGAGGGCVKCRPCNIEIQAEGRTAFCKKPKTALPSPEAWGIDLYTTLQTLGITIEVPPIHTYRCVGMIVAEIPFKYNTIDKKEGIIIKRPDLELPSTNAGKLFDPDNIRCEECPEYSSFLCDESYWEHHDDIYHWLQNKRLYYVELDKPDNFKKTIAQLHKFTLDLHRKGYWWTLPLLNTRCPACEECSLKIHRYEQKYKIVSNRHIPRCVKYFKIDVTKASFYDERKVYGYILC